MADKPSAHSHPDSEQRIKALEDRVKKLQQEVRDLQQRMQSHSHPHTH